MNEQTKRDSDAVSIARIVRELEDGRDLPVNILAERILARIVRDCPECSHPWARHGPEGCEVERPDRYEAGYAPLAPGPCGCMAQKEER